MGLAATVLLSTGGCTTIQPDRSFGRVQELVATRTSTSIAWPTTREARAAIDARVWEHLQHPIDQDRAVAIALINNRELRESYAQLGLAEADFVQAGLLINPGISAGAAFPDRPPGRTGLDFGLTVNLLRAFVMPASREIAELRLDAEVLRSADAVLETAATTRAAFLNLQAAEHLTALLREIAVAAEASAEFASRLHDAGNLSDLALANEEALYEQARLDYARSLAGAADLRERLNVQLGLWGPQTEWLLADRLPDLPGSEPDLGRLESLAVRQRLDLAAAAIEVQAAAKAGGLQRDWRTILTTEVGFNSSRDTDGQWVYGPELTFELPIFDQRQADVARLDSILLAAESRLEGLAIEARSDVRRLRDRLFAARYETEHYRDTIVPLRERITVLTQQHYNFMLVDTFDLLAAKRDEIDAYRGYIGSIHEYWLVRSQLERAVGGSLPAAGAVPSPPAPSSPTHPPGDH